ncbi:MAG: endolytic transglycosylase MltG [bacterium]
MKRLAGILIIVSVGIVLGSLFLYHAWMNAQLPLEKTVQFEIQAGMKGREIGQLLRKKGVIHSVRRFRWAIWLKRAERDLRQGTVRLVPPITMERLVQQLRRKTPVLIRVQIQEGWPSWKIFDVLSRKLDLSRTRFESLFTNKKFLRNQGINARSLEGYMFPDTYYVSADASARQVLVQILERFHEVIQGLDYREKARQQGLSVDEAVRVASLVERETPKRTERPLVSAVYLNRIDRKMRLAADPTLLYEIQDFDQTITIELKRKDSPYNTYERKGLPPTAICNPSRASLKASVNPADVDYLYFVATGDGGHKFSHTAQQHKKAVRKYRDHD